jgi:hypothetical protein
MHEDGVGLPQDFDLAKRYFDQAVETDEAAIVPVHTHLMGDRPFALTRLTHNPTDPFLPSLSTR